MPLLKDPSSPAAQKVYRRLTFLLAVFFPLVLAGRLLWERRMERPPALKTIPDFSLTDERGRVFGSKDLTGKTWIADFIFTRCQGPCPVLTGEMKWLSEKFKDDARVEFVSFTVDPEYDTPDVLLRYARDKGAGGRWHFLTGPAPLMREVVQNGFWVAVSSAAPAELTHGTSIFLVKGNQVRRFYDGMAPGTREIILKDIQNLR